jgi:hypothetical protein
MSERDFTINGMNFKLNKIDVFKQFHIARRLSPIMGEIMAIAPKVKSLKEDMDEKEKFDAIAQLAKPIMDGFSKLSDADANLVLLGLCSAVEIQQTNNWARISNGEVLQFNMLELPVLLQVAARSFMYNVSGFFSIAPQTSHGGK